MTSTANATSIDRSRLRAPAMVLMLCLVAMPVLAGISGPDFSKVFAPDVIGPGSVSMLTFTIDNTEFGSGVTDLAFTDTLPPGMTLAAPAFVSNDCGGTLAAPDGGGTITFADGVVGDGEICTIVVNVTASSSEGNPYDNTSSFLTSSAGTGDTATDTLTIDDGLPGFSKSFAPSTVPFGGRSTLTLTIDNSANGSVVPNLDFTDTLPPGMVVADPNNASTDCGTATIPPTLTAIAGSSVIVLDANGTGGFPAVAAGATCTVVVDVIGGSVGMIGNVSDNLLAEFVEAGKAAAVLEVTGVEDLLELAKEFTDDPVAPGGTVTLEFTVTNKSRDDSATGITFTDDLEATLPGLTPTLPPTPDPPCGAGSTVTFGPPPPGARAARTAPMLLTLTGGTLPPEGSCTFSVELSVPSFASPGSYTNTTGPVSGDVGGSPETGNMAGDLLFVVPPPELVLTKTFTDDPVGAGGGVTLEFTLTNNTASGVTGIDFTDDLNSAIPGLAANGLVAAGGLDPEPLVNPCGSGSELTVFDFNSSFPPPPNFPPDPTMLIFTGGSLAAAGMAGDSCTFSVVVDVPDGAPAGVYTNTSSEVTGSASTTGPAASGDLVVVGAPSLLKEFIDDPVLPTGGPATLRFTLMYEADEGPGPTGIAFSDDLTALSPPVPGLIAASVDANSCGATVDITSDPTMIDVSGGTVGAGASCTIDVILTVPAGAPAGFHTNKTSEVTATVGAVAVTGNLAEDDLLIARLAFSKEFTDDPVIPGDTATLVFTIENNGAASPADDATSIAFTDSLTGALPGLAATGPPSVDTCGGTLSGTTSLTYSGGSLAAGSTCTIEVEVLVPVGTADGPYGNLTSALMATIGGSGVSAPAAVDTLIVDSNVLAISKEFTDDPVLPGGMVKLEFTIDNLSDETVTGIGFEDDLALALTGLTATAPALMNTCGGMAAGLPDTVFSYSGGSLGPMASCTIELLLDVPAAPLVDLPPFLNTTSDVEGTVFASDDVFGIGASDELEVQTLTLEKEFTDDPTTATGTATLEFTLTNLGAAAVSDLAFSDDLDAVISGLLATLPPTPDPPCGVGSSLSGTAFLAVTGASLAAAGSPGDSCTFSVTVTVPESATAGSFLNTTSDLFVFGLPVADPATDFLDIEPAPTFAKEFAPDTILENEVSTLTFTIDNTASSLPATGLDFTDVLPAGVVVATPLVKSTTCTGGMVDATAGLDTISYSGGEVADGASCTVEVEVTSATADTYVNTSGDLTSSSGNSGPASDTLTVEPGEADVELVKSDVFEPVMTGRFQVYTLTATNLGPGVAKAVVIDDVLPVGTLLVVAEPTAACSEAVGIVTCAVGDLALGEAATVVITLYVAPTAMPGPLDNLATVSSDTVDLVPGNNDVMESTEVIPFTGLAMLDDVDGSGFPEAAVPLEGSIEVLVKDVESSMALHQTEVFPDGWLLTGFEKKPAVGVGKDGVAVMAFNPVTERTEVRVIAGDTGATVVTASVPPTYMPLSMAVIPDDGSGRSLIVTASVSLTGSVGRVHVFDCADGSKIGAFPLHPGAVPVGLAGIDSFTGDALAEVGILWINTANGGKRLQVKELSGVPVNLQNLPIAMSPVAIERVADCCGGTSDELAVVGWDQVAQAVRLRVVEAELPASVSDSVFAVSGQPMDVRSMANFGDSSADELMVLLRNPALRAAQQGRDAMSSAVLVKTKYGPPAVGGSVALGLDVSPSAYDTVADEVSVYWLNTATGDMFVTVVDAGSGTEVAEVPIP